MRTVHEWRDRLESSESSDMYDMYETSETSDAMELAVTLVRLGLLFGVLALLGSWWAAVISAALVTVAVAIGLIGADDAR